MQSASTSKTKRRQFFTGAEAKAVEEEDGLERLRTFFQFWSLKEAALKSIGEGLPFGLDAFEFELDPDLRVVHAPPEHGGPGQFNAHVIDGMDNCAALVIRSLAYGKLPRGHHWSLEVKSRLFRKF
jgi:4'-phosphopantetheinyl transferase